MTTEKANAATRSIVAAILLGMIYFALAYVGASTAPGNFKDGTDILTYNSLRVFGSFGNLVFNQVL
jgi:LIVCS family branched-chain amino acid:cation transporter